MGSALAAIHPSPDLDRAEADAREKLIVALDFPTIEAAERLVDELGDEVTFYKVGLGLQLAGGDAFAKKLKKANKRVFLDYKYFDIEETIRNAVARAAEIGIDFLTVHGVGGILKAAVEGKGNSFLKILCVTVLTSMDAADLEEMGYPSAVSVEDLVVQRAKKALAAGVDGVIASPKEITRIRDVSRDKLMIVTPGIRSQGADHGDQKRVGTPYDAVLWGADYLVMGRQITQSSDPRIAARNVISEMAAALKDRASSSRR
ncbi:MAG: orotidine-5'-phosphate decarboxylase [Methylobacteriaceae bacterium]|nr:orotidine-5'-phosphate decarboxylase [Methylobacteriaceae bacterium]